MVTLAEFSIEWERLFGVLVRKAKSFGLDQSTAEDIVQDVAIEAIAKLSTFEDQVHLMRWAQKVVRFRSLDQLAGMPLFLGDGSDLVSRDSANEFVESPLNQFSPLNQVIRDAVEQLPTRQREVLERFSAGETSANIAKALSIMPTTVRSLKRFALAVIEAKVLEYEDRSGIE